MHAFGPAGFGAGMHVQFLLLQRPCNVVVRISNPGREKNITIASCARDGLWEYPGGGNGPPLARAALFVGQVSHNFSWGGAQQVKGHRSSRDLGRLISESTVLVFQYGNQAEPNPGSHITNGNQQPKYAFALNSASMRSVCLIICRHRR
jgi:hypothetical protein